MLWSRGVPVMAVLQASLGHARNECGCHVVTASGPWMQQPFPFRRFGELRLAGVADVGKGVPVLGGRLVSVSKGRYPSSGGIPCGRHVSR
jgi:hypothetical protein